MARSRSNVERIRRPLSFRHVLRGLLVVAGIVGGILVSWALTPQSDLLAFDVALARGAVLGAVVGIGVAALIPLRDAPPPVVRPRPSGFDALRAEMEAERARAAAGRTDPSGAAGGTPPPATDGPAPADPGEITHA